jgi:hypothetical protein
MSRCVHTRRSTPGSHRGRDLVTTSLFRECRVRPGEVVVHVVKRYRVRQVLHLLAESVGEPCKSAHWPWTVWRSLDAPDVDLSAHGRAVPPLVLHTAKGVEKLMPVRRPPVRPISLPGRGGVGDGIVTLS